MWPVLLSTANINVQQSFVLLIRGLNVNHDKVDGQSRILLVAGRLLS